MSEPLEERSEIPASEWLGLVVTNLVKLAGIAVVLVEVFGHDEVRPIVIGVAAFMLAGAQGVENFLRGIFGRPT